MTPEEKRIKIAECCGWKRGKESRTSFANPARDIEYDCWVSPQGVKFNKLPDFLEDLNAMAQAEATLSAEERMKFRIHLCHNSDGRKARYITAEDAMCHATATERADAFLKVKGIL